VLAGPRGGDVRVTRKYEIMHMPPGEREKTVRRWTFRGVALGSQGELETLRALVGEPLAAFQND